MQTAIKLPVVLLFAMLQVVAQGQTSSERNKTGKESWKKELKDQTKRGTLCDLVENVRGDSGKWNDDPRLQHVGYPLQGRSPKMSIDDWADLQFREGPQTLTSNQDTWLLFKSRQLDDNDRIWIDRIERQGNSFTVSQSEAIWQGRYFKSFTYYKVVGVNLGKLPAGDYKVKWIVNSLVFRDFSGDGRPRDKKGKDNWSKNERPADKKPVVLSVQFSIKAASSRSVL